MFSFSVWGLISGQALASCIVLLLFSVLSIPLAIYELIVRLSWTSESISKLAGPIRREVSLTALAGVGYRRSGTTAVYLLEDRAGRKLRINAGLFVPDDEWKPLILSAADRSGARVDPKARVSLGTIDSSGQGRVYLL
jgi:hypothetical protein